jgi:uncharacterized protein (DUF302 family)
MSYYFSKTLACSFDEAVGRATDALGRAGFGIITDIDVKATFRKKLNVEFRDYRILGACNPQMAHAALSIEDKAGTMLPCNIIVQSMGEGRTEVAAIDPVASMQAIENPRLLEAAQHVQGALKAVIEGL